MKNVIKKIKSICCSMCWPYILMQFVKKYHFLTPNLFFGLIFLLFCHGLSPVSFFDIINFLFTLYQDSYVNFFRIIQKCQPAYVKVIGIMDIFIHKYQTIVASISPIIPESNQMMLTKSEVSSKPVTYKSSYK